MELYIEKGFLDYFALKTDSEKLLNRSDHIVSKIFKEYGSATRYTDFSILDLEKTAPADFIIISKLLNEDRHPIQVNNLKDYLFSKSKWKQVLIFTEKKEPWFVEAEKKGAICFSIDSYDERINQFIKNLHFKIDLSEEFNSWDFLSAYNALPFNNLNINDAYILVDEKNQKMDKNISPLIKTMIKEKCTNLLEIKIFTKEILNKEEKNNLKSINIPEEILLLIKLKKQDKLNRQLTNFKCNISIHLVNNRSIFNTHDRVIITNYSTLDSGEGFNLIPFKKSNSQIISETIFDKYTYNRINNHLRELERLKNN